MTLPRIVPVLDVQAGRVVHAVGGRRHAYASLRSVLTDSTDAIEIARAMIAAAGNDELYIADLDAMSGGHVSPVVLDIVQRLQCPIMLDAGDAANIDAPHVSYVHGTERGLPVHHQYTPSDVVSIDLMHGEWWHSETQIDILAAVKQFYNRGARRFIVLDMAAVGCDGGLATLALCEQLKTQFHDVEIITGGGIRERADLQRAGDAGVDALLVASALHRGVRFHD